MKKPELCGHVVIRRGFDYQCTAKLGHKGRHKLKRLGPHRADAWGEK